MDTVLEKVAYSIGRHLLFLLIRKATLWNRRKKGHIREGCFTDTFVNVAFDDYRRASTSCVSSRWVELDYYLVPQELNGM